MTSGLGDPWATLPPNGFWFEGAVIFMDAAGVESCAVLGYPLPTCPRACPDHNTNKQRTAAVETVIPFTGEQL